MLLPLQILNLLEDGAAPVRVPDPDVIIYGWSTFVSNNVGQQGIDILYGFDRSAHLTSFGYDRRSIIFASTQDYSLLSCSLTPSSLHGEAGSEHVVIHGVVDESDVSGSFDDYYLNGKQQVKP